MDNFIFKLCNFWTVILLISFSFVVTCRLWFGDSFSCLNIDASSHYAAVRCYSEGIYITPVTLLDSKKDLVTIEPPAEKVRRYQSHYSWVNLFFLVQAFIFCVPHLLWKFYEKGYVRRLTTGVQAYYDNEEKRALELCYLAKYVLITQGKHKLYTIMYIFCEFCNFFISLTQTVWLVYFFNVTGVPENLPLKIDTLVDFKKFYFPSSGTCEILFPAIGKMHYPLCEIPLNSLYMKMFLCLHSWYIILTILCGLVLFYRIVLLIPSNRILVIKFCASLIEKSVLKTLCHTISYSDWFFLFGLQKTMTDVDFAQMIDKIAILSQCKDENKDSNKRVSFFGDEMKDSDNSNATTPL